MQTVSKIKWAAWTVSIAGLLAEIVPLFNIPDFLKPALSYLLAPLHTVSFMSFRLEFMFYYNSQNGHVTNFFSLLFYVLLFIGALAYTRSEQREVRLLRFCFAIMLFCSVIYFITGFINLFNGSPFSGKLLYWYSFVVNVIETPAMAYLSWWVLKELRATRVLATQGEYQGFVYASRWVRFFHLVVDGVTCLLILSPMVYLLGEDFLRNAEESIGPRTMILFFFIIFRMVYYPFFETLLGATPAKLFSESRVLVDDGQPVSFGAAIKRTLARFIPLEPFSFLGASGWHDQLSYTIVVKEARQGISAGRYLLTIPIVIMLGGAGYFAYDQYKDHQRNLQWKSEYDKKILALQHELDNLTPQHFIKLSGGNGRTFLKIEEVEKDVVYASVVKVDRYDVSLVGAGKYYDVNKEVLSKLMISKNDLHKAYAKEYASISSYAKLLQDDTGYEIEQVFMKDAPVIKGGSSSLGNDYIDLGLENCGWPATLTEIKNIEGNIRWTNVLPQEVQGVEIEQYYCRSFALTGTGYERGTDYKVQFVLEDQNGHPHKFLIEGSGLEKTVTPLQ
jgi:uncharacterized RDD family membrane protein YckC